MPVARDRVGRNNLKLETINVKLTFFKFFAFLFPKRATTCYELFLSRVELISFLSLLLDYFVAI